MPKSANSLPTHEEGWQRGFVFTIEEAKSLDELDVVEGQLDCGYLTYFVTNADKMRVEMDVLTS